LAYCSSLPFRLIQNTHHNISVHVPPPVMFTEVKAQTDVHVHPTPPQNPVFVKYPFLYPFFAKSFKETPWRWIAGFSFLGGVGGLMLYMGNACGRSELTVDHQRRTWNGNSEESRRDESKTFAGTGDGEETDDTPTKGINAVSMDKVENATQVEKKGTAPKEEVVDNKEKGKKSWWRGW
jgi:hypothetical protein